MASMSKEDNARFRGFLLLGVFLGTASTLLYILIVGIGPDWVRVLIALGLVCAVLVIAVLGWRQLAHDSDS